MTFFVFMLSFQRKLFSKDIGVLEQFWSSFGVVLLEQLWFLFLWLFQRSLQIELKPPLLQPIIPKCSQVSDCIHQMTKDSLQQQHPPPRQGCMSQQQLCTNTGDDPQQSQATASILDFGSTFLVLCVLSDRFGVFL